jgi:hypothetical protein
MKEAGFLSMQKIHADVSHSYDFYTVSHLGHQLQAALHGYFHLLPPEKQNVTISNTALSLSTINSIFLLRKF